MFSPILLVCLMEVPIEPQSCFLIAPEVFFLDWAGCNSVTQSTIDEGFFRKIGTNGLLYDAVSYTCVDWKGEKI